MSEPAVTPAPEPLRLDLLMQQAIAEIREARRLIEQDIAQRGNLTELVLNSHRLAALESRIVSAALLSAVGDMGDPEPEPAPRRHRHRASKRTPAQRPLYPRALRGAVPLGAIGAAARHSWPAAHPVAASAIALSLAAGTAAVVPHTAATFGFGGSPATRASVPGWQTSASPMPLPSSSLIARSVTRPKPNTVTVTGPLTYAPAPPQGSYAPPSGDPVPQDSPPVQVQAAGVLSVSTTALDLTGTGTGTLTLTCTGGGCPWHVVAGGVLSADVRQGDLQDGESVTVTLTVDPAALALGGSGVVKVWPGDVEVTVSWAAPPVQVPSVVPSVLPSVLPTIAGV